MSKTEQPKDNYRPWPAEAIDTLPKGYTILGWGGSFKTNGLFNGVVFDADYPDDLWDKECWCWNIDNLLYAAPSDSDVVKLNKPWSKSPIDGEIREFEESKVTDAQERKESICEEALRIQGGDRQQDYGDPTENFQDIAYMWNEYIYVAKGQESHLEPRDVAHMMILMKIARNCHKPKRDNWVDIAGYAQCGGKIDKI